MPEFDVIVIGAGPAGEVLAGRTAAAGLSTAIVEESLVGGECGFYACMPSNALLHPGEVLDEIRHVPGAREAARGQLAVQAVLDNRGPHPWRARERRAQLPLPARRRPPVRLHRMDRIGVHAGQLDR